MAWSSDELLHRPGSRITFNLPVSTVAHDPIGATTSTPRSPCDTLSLRGALRQPGPSAGMADVLLAWNLYDALQRPILAPPFGAASSTNEHVRRPYDHPRGVPFDRAPGDAHGADRRGRAGDPGADGHPPGRGGVSRRPGRGWAGGVRDGRAA